MPVRRRRRASARAADRAHARRLARPRRPASGPGSATATGCTARGTPGTGTASTRPSCSSTPTPGRSTARCASTRRARPDSAGDDTVPTRATRRRSCRARSSSTPAFDWRRRPAAGRAVGGHGRLRAARARASPLRTPACPSELRGTYAGLAHPAALEHLVGLGVTTVELLPVHHFVSEPTLLRRGLDELLGLQHARLLRAARRLLVGGRRAAQQVAEFKRRWCGRCTPPGSRCCSTSSTTTPPRATPTARRCRWRGLDNAAYYRLRARPAATSTSPAAATRSTCATRARCAMVTDSLRYWVAGDARRRLPVRPRPGAGARHRRVRRGRHLPHRARPGPGAVPGQARSPSRGTSGPAATSSAASRAPWAEWNDRYRDTVRESWLGGHGAREPGGGVRDLAYRLSGSSDVFEAGGRGRWPRSTSSPRTTASRCTTSCPTTASTTRPTARTTATARDNNHSWNCGVEGATDDPDVLRAAPPDDAQPADDAAARPPACRCSPPATRPAAPRAATTTPTASTTRRPGCPGTARAVAAATCSPGPARCSRCAASTRCCATTSSSRAARRTPTALKDLAWFGTDGQEMTPERWFDARPAGARAATCRPSRSPDGGPAPSLLVLLNTGRDGADVRLPGAAVGVGVRRAARHRRRAAGRRGPTYEHGAGRRARARTASRCSPPVAADAPRRRRPPRAGRGPTAAAGMPSISLREPAGCLGERAGPRAAGRAPRPPRRR